MSGRQYMPDKLSEEDVKKWMRQIYLSLAWRKDYEDTWDRIIGMLKSKYFDKLSDEDRICVNMVHPHVRVVVPAIYSRNPDVLVSPKKFDSLASAELITKRAEVIQRVLKYLVKELDLKTEVKLCIIDAILTGQACVKTGYETEFSEDERDLVKPTLISELLVSLGIKEKPAEKPEEEEYLTNQKITYEQPWALRVSPYDVIVPVLSRRPEELYWIGERIIHPYDQVMANDRYDTKGLKPSANANQLLASLRGYKHKSLNYGDDCQYVILYEIWDGIEKSVITLAEGHNKPLEVKDSEYTFLDSKYHPYRFLRFNEVPDEFYPESDIEPAEPQLEELNETRTQQMAHRKRYNRKYISKPGAFDPTAKQQLKEGEDGTVVEHSNILLDTPISEIIYPIADAAMPADVYAFETRIKDDIFTILGTSDYASQASGGARTATEANIIATQSRFRVEERIDLVGQFVGGIVRNLAQIAQKFMTPEQIKDIVGMDALYWVQLQRDADIRGEFLYDIVYASSAPINREVDREQFAQFYGMAANDPYYNQIKLRLELARKFALDNPESWLEPKIAEIIEKQRLAAAKQGILLEGVINRPGSRQAQSSVNGRTGVERLPTGQPSGLPGDLGEAPVPGGSGGTNLA